ncbi:MAG: AmmeMemoRadiSam system radical SAM enzyme [Candidatus Delongbacteria bacterium]|nr:AmmeMemoRadiSam system radical SAM enzyme [Candidatus Delongbacteria bacterium]
MKYFKKIEDTATQPMIQSTILCSLCEHRCILKEGAIGKCRVNTNVNGELVCLVHSKPIAVHVDPIEKKPLFHFEKGSNTYSLGTYGCNFKCQWCQNYQISQSVIADMDTIPIVTPEEIVHNALTNNCTSVSYTYNEPTIFYPYAKDIGVLAKEKELKNIFVSNGFQTEEVIEDMKLWVDACNIDLKCFNVKNCKMFTGSDINIVLRNLKLLAKSDIHLEITTLVIPDFNDSNKELKQIANFIADNLGANIPWHVSAFHPDYKMTDKTRTSKDTIFKAMEIGAKQGLKYVYPGNIW